MKDQEEEEQQHWRCRRNRLQKTKNAIIGHHRQQQQQQWRRRRRQRQRQFHSKQTFKNDIWSIRRFAIAVVVVVVVGDFKPPPPTFLIKDCLSVCVWVCVYLTWIKNLNSDKDLRIWTNNKNSKMTPSSNDVTRVWGEGMIRWDWDVGKVKRPIQRVAIGGGGGSRSRRSANYSIIFTLQVLNVQLTIQVLCQVQSSQRQGQAWNHRRLCLERRMVQNLGQNGRLDSPKIFSLQH